MLVRVPRIRVAASPRTGMPGLLGTARGVGVGVAVGTGVGVAVGVGLGLEPSNNDMFNREFGNGHGRGSGASFGNGSAHEAPLRRRRGSRPSGSSSGPHRKVYPLGVSLSRLREAIQSARPQLGLDAR